MIELRWKIEEWEEYTDMSSHPIKHTEKPVLQYRTMTNIEEIGLQEPIWSEWTDVPEVYIKT